MFCRAAMTSLTVFLASVTAFYSVCAPVLWILSVCMSTVAGIHDCTRNHQLYGTIPHPSHNHGFRELNDAADASARGLVRQQLMNALPLMFSLMFVR